MERPIKGGYILISLGLIALSTSYSGSIDYDRISKTKKYIVLTGIKVATTVMPDITVKPIYGNGTITFEDVYGFDIVISSNNSVSVSEHVAPSSGTKLYKHVITNNDNFSITVISEIATPYTNLLSFFDDFSSGTHLFSFVLGTYAQNRMVGLSGSAEGTSYIYANIVSEGSFASQRILTEVTTVVDTVTEL